MAQKIFKEKQRFRDWEVFALLAFFILALTYKFIDQHLISPTANAMTLGSYLVFLTPLIAGLVYLWSLKLSVTITDKHISLKYAPLHTKKHKIKWDDIEECEVLKTSPTAAWSGWKVSFNHEKSYSLSGRTGLHLKTKQGEDIIIGVKKCDELKKAVRQVLSDHKE